VKNKSNPSFHFIFKKWPKEKINGQKRKKIASGKNTSSQKEKNSQKWPVSRKMEMAKKE